MIGAISDNASVGAAWVFTRTAGRWTQQGSKITGAGEMKAGEFAYSLALSADGNTAMVGAVVDNTAWGAEWVFTRTAGVWAQQGSKLLGGGEHAWGLFGSSTALSPDGNTALIGGILDGPGSVWIFKRAGGVWTQQGTKFTGAGEVGVAEFGTVALSGDGATALVGGQNDNTYVGAAWAYLMH